MNLVRKILSPLAVLYGIITSIRNFLFDVEILKSYSFTIPIIAVGNLSVGGTGKTPQIEYLIRLLSPKYKIATLSRGYKRQSKGFILANSNSNASVLGDEPFQFYTKFNSIQVAVDTDRKNGIEQLLSQETKPEIILLDDAFQHRKVKAGFYILLTPYNDLYANDWMLPTGNLRECKNGVKRANLIVVTKCPRTISTEEQNIIKTQLNLQFYQKLYFSYIDYDDFVYAESQKVSVSEIKNQSKLLLAGIANPKPFFSFLKNEKDLCLTFSDHHHFTEKDIVSIINQANGKIIITTEKDYVRLKSQLPNNQLYYLPIQSLLLNEPNNFDNTILDFVAGKYFPSV